MTKGIALTASGLLLLVAVATVGSGLVQDPTIAAAVYGAAVLGIIGIYAADRRRQRQSTRIAAAYSEERFRALSASARSPQFELVVGSAGIFSKPKIVLGRGGFSTPLTPPLSWQLVEAIDLHENRSREELVSHDLVFLIPSLPDYLPRFGLFHRLLYRLRGSLGRQQLRVTLSKPSEPAKAVFRMALLYWKLATGRSNPTNPLVLFGRVAAYLPLKADAPAVNPALADLAEFEESDRLLERYHAGRRFVWLEKRRRARYGALACLLLVGALVYFGVPWEVIVFAGLIGLVAVYVAFIESESAIVPLPFFPAGTAAASDPAAEAELYLAYDRHKQAIELLEEALRKDPSRADVAKRLGELRALG